MKKIITFLIAAVLAMSYTPNLNAQVDFRHTTTNPTGLITDTGADTMTLTLTRGYSFIVIQPKFVKATGTLAGKSKLQYSVNGVQYISTDSLTLTNVADGGTFWHSTVGWVKSIPARYWRIITNGGTTMSVTTSAKLSTD